MYNIQEWITSQKTIEKSRRVYAHFDNRTDISKCQNYITNPKNIALHNFFPFIHYEKDMTKYHREKGMIPKSRDICYAAHMDRCIYQLYSYILNELYNHEIKRRGIDSVPVAYRTDLGLNNIHIAKKAMDFIRNNLPCYVIIGDFTGFFDNLDHQYLKRRWCDLLQVKSLPEDHYAVFKNITRYSKWELSDLCKINGLEYTRSGLTELNSKRVVLSKQQFHRYRSHISKNLNPYGIPQGSPISAILANLYMIDVDTEVYKLVTDINGLYMRYSDDFIVVLPQNNGDICLHTIGHIKQLFNGTKRITLEPRKTQYYIYDNNRITNCGYLFDNNNTKNTIDFLGFSFDGDKVTIRPKTITKYYNRMYRKAKTIRKNKGFTKHGNKISKRNLYEHYSIKGANGKRGNFLTYVGRAKTCFGPDENIDKSTKNHLQKIKKALKP